MRKSEVLAAESVACLNKALCHLKDIWEEIGIPEEQRLERTNVVKNHIKDLLERMIAEEENLRKRLMISIETCRKELSKVCSELQLPAFQEERSNSMLQQEKDIRTFLEAMLKEKSHRMQTLKVLIEQDQDLCDVLCCDSFCISDSSVPSLEQLERYREHLAALAAEKEERRSKFVELKKKIILCMEDLDQLPETSFEKDIVCEEEEAFCLSRENIDSLKILLHQVLHDFSEELLSLHDAEILRLKQHYEEHKDLFEGVQRWEESWRLFLELEKKATDPSRFTNRGGNLLKEEKQRTDLLKSLPKLEKKLKLQVEQWEEQQGREFLVGGQKFLQFVGEQWEQHRLEKEREKQERQLKKSKQTEEDMLYGTAVRTPTKRRFLGSATPCKTRKLNGTSSTTNSTIRSALSSAHITVCHSPLSRPPISASKGAAVRTPGRGKPPHPALLERNKENIGFGNPAAVVSSSPQRNHSINSVASTYSEFARDLCKASKSKCTPDVLNSTITHL
uniref:Protein regulator of cytokinesis 1b n=1 Tax=Astyanax mexicanus TaxID=7994 RepID=A0A3B1J875_ASTMX